MTSQKILLIWFSAAAGASYVRSTKVRDPAEWASYTMFKLSDEQKQSYLWSLTFEQIDVRHSTIYDPYQSTCEWLLEEPEYRDWLSVEKLPEHHGFLWIKGKAATGKSTIMKFLLEATRMELPDSMVISFFFHARGVDLEKNSLGMYRSLLFQILRMAPDLQDLFALQPPALANDQAFVWDIPCLQTLFRHVMKHIGNRVLTCFIDALDECDDDEAREMVTFFEDLGRLAASSQVQFRTCFSSRHYPHITIEHCIPLHLDQHNGHQQDIVQYVSKKLKIGSSALAVDVKKEICQRSSGIFLWAILVVKILQKVSDYGQIHLLRKRLREIPDGLDDLFDDILIRDGQNMEKLVLCIQWILFAKRPLSPEELYHAILVGVEPDSIKKWDPDEIDQTVILRFILTCSKGLAEVTKGGSPTVQFIHESVRNYLLKARGLQKLQADPTKNFHGMSHDRLKDCCQAYIDISGCQHPFWKVSSQTFIPTRAEELSRQRICRSLPLLEYAVLCLVYHADLAQEFGIGQDSFVEYFSHDNYAEIYKILEERYHYMSAVPTLYLFADLNASNLVSLELKRVPRLNIEGEPYYYPLIVALIKGHEKTVKALLHPNSKQPTDCGMRQQHDPAIQKIVRAKLRYLEGLDITSWAAKHNNIDLVM